MRKGFFFYSFVSWSMCLPQESLFFPAKDFIKTQHIKQGKKSS